MSVCQVGGTADFSEWTTWKICCVVFKLRFFSFSPLLPSLLNDWPLVVLLDQAIPKFSLVKMIVYESNLIYTYSSHGPVSAYRLKWFVVWLLWPQRLSHSTLLFPGIKHKNSYASKDRECNYGGDDLRRQLFHIVMMCYKWNSNYISIMTVMHLEISLIRDYYCFIVTAANDLIHIKGFDLNWAYLFGKHKFKLCLLR